MRDRKHEHTTACLITKPEAARLAGVTVRTIDLWADRGLIIKLHLGPTGYPVRFCAVDIREATAIRSGR